MKRAWKQVNVTVPSSVPLGWGGALGWAAENPQDVTKD